MKRYLPAIAVFILFVFISSCTKNDSKDSADAQQRIVDNAPGNPPNQISYVTLSGNQYITQYGGGATFGGTFPYPLTVTASQNYTLYYPSINTAGPIIYLLNGNYVDQNNVLSVIVRGAYIVVVEGTFGGGPSSTMLNAMSDSIGNYANTMNGYQTSFNKDNNQWSTLEAAINNDNTSASVKAADETQQNFLVAQMSGYINQMNALNPPNMSAIAAKFGSGSSIIATSGAFVLYNDSPTNVAIIPISQVPKPHLPEM